MVHAYSDYRGISRPPYFSSFFCMSAVNVMACTKVYTKSQAVPIPEAGSSYFQKSCKNRYFNPLIGVPPPHSQQRLSPESGMIILGTASLIPQPVTA